MLMLPAWGLHFKNYTLRNAKWWHSFYMSIKRTSLVTHGTVYLGKALCFAGFEHKITVQASPTLDKRKGSDGTSPPASPSIIPRLRAIRREYLPRP